MAATDQSRMDLAPGASLFETIKDRGETILWTGRPTFWPFVLKAIPVLIIGGIWGLIDYAFFFGTGMANDPQFRLFVYPFLALHTFPTWGSVLYAAYLAISWSRTLYAYSNRRLLLRNGVLAPAYRSMDYDAIRDLSVGVNLGEKLFAVGHVTASDGSDAPLAFAALADPYEVFQAIKQVEVDVKTDWEYPNALRPDENPGYRTRYDGPDGKRP